MSNQTETGNCYGYWQIAADTWCITDHWKSFMYLLIGQERAMLIDTGSGEGNIREVAEALTDKNIMVVNTHGHFDHTGGNSCWPEAWMSEAASLTAKKPFDQQHREWFLSKAFPDYHIHSLKEQDRIDLGGRIVEIIEIPAHSEGSIALLDPHTRSLFCGDELESGQVLFIVRNQWMPACEIAALQKRNMEKLAARRQDYDWIWPAHNGGPLYPDGYLRDFTALDELLINDQQKAKLDTCGFGFPEDSQKTANPFQGYGPLKRAEYGRAAVIYSEKGCVYHTE